VAATFFWQIALEAQASNTGAYTNTIGQIGVQTTDYSSNYNSLQASLNRMFSNGLTFQIAYTWSRNFDYTSNLENSAFNGPGINNFDVLKITGPPPTMPRSA